MFKFIHAADVHLDSPLRGLERYERAPVDEIRGASRRALENLVDLAIEEEVAFVLIAGDLYDGDWKDYNTGLFFVSQAGKLRDAGIALYLIQGNHDAANKMTKSLRLPDNPDGSASQFLHTKAESIELENLGVVIHGRGFGRQAEKENLAAKYPATRKDFYNIGILHTSLDGAPGHDTYAPCGVNDLLRKEYQYWALGHVHQRANRNPDTDGPPLWFPGNIQGRHIRESGAKGCLLVSVDDNHRTEAEFRPLDVLRWEHIEIDANNAKSKDDVLESFAGHAAHYVKKHEERPLAVRVTISGHTEADQALRSDAEHWKNEIRAAASSASSELMWVEKVKVRTRPSVPPLEELLEDGGAMAEIGRVIHSLREDNAALLGLNEHLADFTNKLPEELTRGEDSLGLDRPEIMREVLDDIEPLLAERLTKGASA